MFGDVWAHITIWTHIKTRRIVPSHLSRCLTAIISNFINDLASAGASCCSDQSEESPSPPPWTIERLPGGFKVGDAHGQSRVYFYARENDNDAGTAGVLTRDEARRLTSNFAKLPEPLGKS